MQLLAAVSGDGKPGELRGLETINGFHRAPSSVPEMSIKFGVFGDVCLLRDCICSFEIVKEGL